MARKGGSYRTNDERRNEQRTTQGGGYLSFTLTVSAQPRSRCPCCGLSRRAFPSLSAFHAHIAIAEQVTR